MEHYIFAYTLSDFLSSLLVDDSYNVQQTGLARYGYHVIHYSTYATGKTYYYTKCS